MEERGERGWRASVLGVFRGRQSNFVSHGCGSVLRASASAMDVRMPGEAHLRIRFVMQSPAGMFLWQVARTCPCLPVAAIGMLMAVGVPAALTLRGAGPQRPEWK